MNNVLIVLSETTSPPARQPHFVAGSVLRHEVCPSEASDAAAAAGCSVVNERRDADSLIASVFRFIYTAHFDNSTTSGKPLR